MSAVADYMYRGEAICHVCLEHRMGEEWIAENLGKSVREIDRHARCEQAGCVDMSGELTLSEPDPIEVGVGVEVRERYPADPDGDLVMSSYTGKIRMILSGAFCLVDFFDPSDGSRWSGWRAGGLLVAA